MGGQEVEDVEGPLVGRLVGHPGLLQEVGLDVAAGHPPHGVEPYADELAEAGGVVVPHGLGVAVGLQDGVGLHNLESGRDWVRLLHCASFTQW